MRGAERSVCSAGVLVRRGGGLALAQIQCCKQNAPLIPGFVRRFRESQ